MIKTCDEDLVGMRDRALLFFSFASGGGVDEARLPVPGLRT